MLNYINYLNLPTKIAFVVVGLMLVLQVIGEIIEFAGKSVPEIMKIRKYFIRKKKEKQKREQTFEEVQRLLQEVNGHYSADNIAKRDKWMDWVNGRAVVYDNTIVEMTSKLSDVTQALNDNTKMTEEMFIQSSRDRIIDFATKVQDKNVLVSREEFNRIFKVYDKYEKFLESRKLTNGEVDINYQIIKESYEEHLRNHTFIEDIRGYNN